MPYNSSFGSPNLTNVRGTQQATVRAPRGFSQQGSGYTPEQTGPFRNRASGPVMDSHGGAYSGSPTTVTNPQSGQSQAFGGFNPGGTGYSATDSNGQGIGTGFDWNSLGQGQAPPPSFGGGQQQTPSGFWSGDPNTVNTGIPGQNTFPVPNGFKPTANGKGYQPNFPWQQGEYDRAAGNGRIETVYGSPDGGIQFGGQSPQAALAPGSNPYDYNADVQPNAWGQNLPGQGQSYGNIPAASAAMSGFGGFAPIDPALRQRLNLLRERLGINYPFNF